MEPDGESVYIHPPDLPVEVLKDEKIRRRLRKKDWEPGSLSALNAISIFTFGCQSTDTFSTLPLVNSPVSGTQGKGAQLRSSTPDHFHHQSRLHTPSRPYKTPTSLLSYPSRLSLRHHDFHHRYWFHRKGSRQKTLEVPHRYAAPLVGDTVRDQSDVIYQVICRRSTTPERRSGREEMKRSGKMV